MGGYHNIRIYTIGDNPWCESCINGEKIQGNGNFKTGACICHCGGVPTKKICTKYMRRIKPMITQDENKLMKAKKLLEKVVEFLDDNMGGLLKVANLIPFRIETYLFCRTK